MIELWGYLYKSFSHAEGDYYCKPMYLKFVFVERSIRGSVSNIRELENISPRDF